MVKQKVHTIKPGETQSQLCPYIKYVMLRALFLHVVLPIITPRVIKHHKSKGFRKLSAELIYMNFCIMLYYHYCIIIVTHEV